MIINYEKIIPSPIQNTNVVKGIVDGNHSNYQLYPVPGYVLHDHERDWREEDIDGTVICAGMGYIRGVSSCGANYDFSENPRQFFAIPESSVILPNKIF